MLIIGNLLRANGTYEGALGSLTRLNDVSGRTCFCWKSIGAIGDYEGVPGSLIRSNEVSGRKFQLWGISRGY